MIVELDFDFPQGRDFSLLHWVQASSGVHPTSYPVCVKVKVAGEAKPLT
jgi:hypothetical protein